MGKSGKDRAAWVNQGRIEQHG